MVAQLRRRPQCMGWGPADTRGKPCRGRSEKLRARVDVALMHRKGKFCQGYCPNEPGSLALAAESWPLGKLWHHPRAAAEKPVSVAASLAHAVAREAWPHSREGAHSGRRGTVQGSARRKDSFRFRIFSSHSPHLKTAPQVNARQQKGVHQAALILGPRCVPCRRGARRGPQFSAPFFTWAPAIFHI